MKTSAIVFVVLLVSSLALGESNVNTYTGVITDTMCAGSHGAMKISPDSRCVRECVGNARTHRYALLDGTRLYTLSDQETPARFAATRVTVTGVLYTKTNILKVETIASAR